MLSTPLYFAAWDDDLDCWAVQRRADDYRQIAADPLFARCRNEADARKVAEALNEHDAVMTPRGGWVPSPPTSAPPFQWESRRGEYNPHPSTGLELPPMQEQPRRTGYAPMFRANDATANRCVSGAN